MDLADTRRIRRLASRAERERTGRFVVEGLAPFLHACWAEVPLVGIVWSRILLRNAEARSFVRRKRRAGVPTRHVSPEAFREVTSAARASGVLAIARQRWTSIENLDPHRGLVRIAVERIRSPGNLGTIVRTAEAVGAAGIVFVGGASDPFEPATVKASMGTVLDLELTRASHVSFAAWARRHEVSVVGTSPAADRVFTDVPARRPLALMLGDERTGLSDAALGLCTECVRIPILGVCDSLNVGVAAGVVLYELLGRQHGRPAMSKTEPRTKRRAHRPA